jgi:hypothetical protein
VRGRLLALIVGLLLVAAAPAAASASSFGEQTGGQSADNTQSATSSATSTQVDPSNENISVRVLSPGDDGDVSQSNNSSAHSGAINSNATGQSLTQSQPGGSSAAQKAMQDAAQWAGNDQSADSTAESTQQNPSNENISVRVLSEGDNGSVDQSNNSNAKSFAGNKNDTSQTTEQGQGGPATGGGTPAGTSSDLTRGTTPADPTDGCGCGSKSIQAGGQDAHSKQDATSTASSTQDSPSNDNIAPRILDPGDDGSVDQSNNSQAESFAGNNNATTQELDQSQAGMSDLEFLRGILGGSLGIQAGGQDAWNEQDATSNADSTQFAPSNSNGSVGVPDGPWDVKDGPGDGGDVTQSNNSSSESKALNLNGLMQLLRQFQGSGGDLIPA